MKFLKLIILATLFLTIPQFMKRNFKLPPIHAGIPINPEWEAPPLSEEILLILDQPFRYFSHGNQSTVFESADGNYVLKIFRYRRSLFPLIHNFKNLFKSKPKQNFLSKVNKTFNAAHLACTRGKEFTQVVYCHLNLTEHLLPTIQLQADRIYKMPLDSYRFALQKKVSPFKETLLAAKNNPEEMHRLMDSFIQLLIDRSALNIRNSDPNLGPNFGFLDGRAVELDFGNYHMIEPNGQVREDEIENLLNRFEKWLNTNAPEYVKELRLKRAISYDRKT